MNNGGTVETISHGLTQAVQGAGKVLQRAHANNDTCVGLLSGAGEVIALDEHAYLGGLAVGAKRVLDHIGSNLRRGDIVITNDPYSGAISLRHILLLCPVYGASPEPVAILVAQAKVPDVGGAVGGGRAHGATELLAEGVRITPVRLHRHGKSDHGLLETILLNSREPEVFRCAIAGMRNAVESVEVSLRKLLGEYGDSTVGAVFDEVLERAEREARMLLRRIPNASVSAARRLPSDGTGRNDLLVSVTVQKGRHRLVLNFSQTGSQSTRFVNSSFSNTWKCATSPFALRLEGSGPVNGGTLRCLEIKANEGSLVRPTLPAPTGWGVLCPGAEIFDVVNEALQSLLTDEVDLRYRPSLITTPPGHYDGLAALLANKA
jgi:N-methylhydantoinase B